MNIQDLEDLVANIHLLSPAEQEQVHRLITELDARSHATQCRNDLISFYKHMVPEYIDGAHLRLMSKNFMALANGDKKRLCVNLPPRHGKSNLISTIFPAWYIGNNPNHKVMLVSHTADLAIDFGRKIRNLIASPEYQKVFPNVTLANDSKAAGSWMTNHGGVFYATGVGAALAGRGANLLLCLRGDTLVNHASKGEVKLFEIQEGDYIQSRYGWERVDAKCLTTHSIWYRIDGITCSAEHPFLTTKGWMEAQYIRAGDKLITNSIWKKLWTSIHKLVKRGTTS